MSTTEKPVENVQEDEYVDYDEEAANEVTETKTQEVKKYVYLALPR